MVARRYGSEPTNDLPQQMVLCDLLRLAFEPLALDELLRQVLERLVHLPWLGLAPRGAIDLIEPGRAGRIRRVAQVGAAEALEAAPSLVCPMLARACLGHQPAGVLPLAGEPLARLCGVSRPGGEAQYCLPIVAGSKPVGLLRLAVAPGHQTSEPTSWFLHAVADVLAGIIERHRVEQSLAASEERFDLAVRGTDAGIWDWDLRTNQVYFSERWKSMLGYRPEEIEHRFTEWDSRLHPADRALAHQTIHDYLSGRSAEYELEHRLRHKDGSYRWILARGAAVRDRQGRPYRMVGSHLDVTERRRLEAALAQRQAQLQAVQKILAVILPHGPLVGARYEIAGSSLPADYAQGDYFHYFPRPDGTVLAVIADVSGHGVDAALLMAMTHAWLHALAELPIPITELVERLNRRLCTQTADDRFVTLALLELDPAGCTLHYVGAGHPSIDLFDAQGRLKGTFRSQSWPLGLEYQGTFPTTGPIALEPGDLLLALTDGVIEARSPRTGELFGVERVRAVVSARAQAPLAELLESLHAAVRAHCAPQTPGDDLTAMVARLR